MFSHWKTDDGDTYEKKLLVKNKRNSWFLVEAKQQKSEYQAYEVKGSGNFSMKELQATIQSEASFSDKISSKFYPLNHLPFSNVLPFYSYFYFPMHPASR